MNLSFNEEQLKKFDNALDILAERGYSNEIKHQRPKVIGASLITYSVMRVDPDVDNPKFGDILVVLTYEAGKSWVSFYKPSTSTAGGKEEISASEIMRLPKI